MHIEKKKGEELLVGPGVAHFQTAKVTRRPRPPVGVVLHYTGAIAKADLRGAFGPLRSEVVRVGDGLYHAITDAQMQALVALCAALRDHFGIARTGWYRHAEIRPDNRTDPEPPVDVRALVERLYPEPAEPAEEADALVASLA